MGIWSFIRRNSCTLSGPDLQEAFSKQTNARLTVIKSHGYVLMQHFFKIILGMDS